GPSTQIVPSQNVQAIQDQHASNSIQELDQVMKDIHETMMDDTDMGHVLHALFHPVTKGWREEALKITKIKNDLSEAKGLPDSQTTTVVESLEHLAKALNGAADSFNEQRPNGKGFQSNQPSHHFKDMQTLD